MPISKAVATKAGSLLRDATQERRVLAVAGAALSQTVREEIRERTSEGARGFVAGFFGSFGKRFG